MIDLELEGSRRSRTWRAPLAGIDVSVRTDELANTQSFSVSMRGRPPTDEEVEAARLWLVERGELADRQRREGQLIQTGMSGAGAEKTDYTRHFDERPRPSE